MLTNFHKECNNEVVFPSMGYALGGVVAVLVMNVYPGINQDAIIYAHGFVMSLGSIGIYTCLKEHDRNK